MNLATDNGVYLMKMDFTDSDTNTSEVMRVSWSFDILGTSSDPDMNPTGWVVRVNYGNENESINVSDAWFINSISQEVQTFDFVNAGSAGTSGWVTVSGYYDIDVGEAGTLGSIQIRPSAGGYLSGGTGAITLDNINVTVDIAPPDLFTLDEVIDFEKHDLDEVLATDTALYDYTRNTVFENGSNTIANSMVFKGGSGTDYVIQDRGVGHEKALFLTGAINTSSSSDNGIYLLKVDMTAGGENATQVVRVAWSFDILGTSNDADFDPTGWKVNLNYANSSEDINVSDAWFDLETEGRILAQTFDFVNAGLDGTNGWTTVSGYYDVPIGEGRSLGSIQIRS